MRPPGRIRDARDQTMTTGRTERGWSAVRRERVTLFAMCFGLFMIMLDNTIVNVALPSIQRELHVSPETLAWTVNAYVVPFAALILLGGKLGDRFGRRRVFIVGLAIFTASSAACALSTSSGMLVAARAIQGTGAALMNPLSLSILVATFPPKRLPVAIGVWAGISGLGLAIGPLLGGLLVENADWSAVFWINVPIGILAIVVTLLGVLESRDKSTRSLDLPGTALITAALFCLVWGLIKSDTHGFGSAYVIAFLAAGLGLALAFVAWERQCSDPMLPIGFFTRRAFTVSDTVMLLVGFAMFGAIYWGALYLQNIQGYSALQAGARTLPWTMMILFVAPIAGRLNARISARYLAAAGMVLLSGGMIGLTQLQRRLAVLAHLAVLHARGDRHGTRHADPQRDRDGGDPAGEGRRRLRRAQHRATGGRRARYCGARRGRHRPHQRAVGRADQRDPAGPARPGDQAPPAGRRRPAHGDPSPRRTDRAGLGR